jgi:cobalt/nickel transport system permease protein
MQADFADRFSRGTSIIHRIDARWKLLAAIALITAVVLTPLAWWPLLVVETVIVFEIYAFSDLPWRYLGLRLLALGPFLVILALGVPLSRGLRGGWDLAGLLLLRSLLSLTIMITLVATTRFSQLLLALSRLRVPQLLISILAFMYRYMFVLADELAKMRRAKLARTFYPSIWRELRMMGHFAAMLFVRAFERAERVHAAMCARGWRGAMPTRDDDR